MYEKDVFGWLKVTFVKQCKEENVTKMGQLISHKLLGQFLSNFVRKVAYMEGIKYVNVIEIGQVVIEI